MIHRYSGFLLLLPLLACNSERSAEIGLREKFAKNDCFISTNTNLTVEQRRWHSRSDCIDLTIESGFGNSDRKLAPTVLVHPKPDGLYDGQGSKYEHHHCIKCVR